MTFTNDEIDQSGADEQDVPADELEAIEDNEPTMGDAGRGNPVSG